MLRWLAPFGVIDRSDGSVGHQLDWKSKSIDCWNVARSRVSALVLCRVWIACAWSWYVGTISHDERVLIEFVVCFPKPNQSAKSPPASLVSVVLVDIINGTDGDW